MGIVAEDVERVRLANPLHEVVSASVALRRVGRRWTGLCPFHAEKTPSFSVNDELGLYYCFGCGQKGDVITFVREHEHLDFAGAVEWLARRAGIQVRYDDRAEAGRRSRRAVLVDALGRAVDWYHQRLLTGPDSGQARAYLRSRGYDREVVERYRIGWAPGAWDELARALRVPDDVWRETGLGSLDKRGRQIDGFRGRVLFPVFDAAGDAVGLGGRILPGGEGPKYRNSPEGPLYAKSRTLYGLNWAKGAVVDADEVVVCEGYTDVIGFHRAGVAQAVATCGTALTEDHVRLLRRFASKVVLAFDADTAGQAAAERFANWEHTYDLSVRVCAFPPGTDPADLAGRDPQGLRKLVAEAQPYLGFLVDRVLAGIGAGSGPEARARAAEAALELLASHPSELVRREYAGQVAVRCGLPVADLVRLAERRVRTPRLEVAAPRAGQAGAARDAVEAEALRLAVHRPEAMAPVLVEELFGDDLHRRAFLALAEATTLGEALSEAPADVADLLGRLATEETDADPDEVGARLVERSARRVLDTVRDDPLAHTWVLQRLHELRVPALAPAARTQLVAWLSEHREGGA